MRTAPRLSDIWNIQLSPAQILAGLSTTIGTTTLILLWLTATFQSKGEASNDREDFEKRMAVMERNLKKIDQISIDVGVIKVLLEKQNKK